MARRVANQQAPGYVDRDGDQSADRYTSRPKTVAARRSQRAPYRARLAILRS
jgi:hypothetical protein